MYKRVIYNTQHDLYLVLTKVLGALYSIYRKEVKKDVDSVRHHEILEDFSGISSMLSTEYSLRKTEELGSNELLVAFSEVCSLPETISGLFEKLPSDTYEIEVHDATDLERLHINRLFGNHVKFIYR